MTTNSKLSPIPVDYVVGHAMALNTAAKRKPYTDLILQWAEHEGMEAEGRSIVGAQIKVNRFDSIICSMIPGKGKDTVRKKGDYSIMLDRSSSYRTWSITSLNPIEAYNRSICDEIVKKLKPILLRNDPSQQEA